MGIRVATVFMVAVGKRDDWQAVFVQGAQAFVKKFGCVPKGVWLHPDAPEIETDGVDVFYDAGIVPRRTIHFEVPGTTTDFGNLTDKEDKEGGGLGHAVGRQNNNGMGGGSVPMFSENSNEVTLAEEGGHLAPLPIDEALDVLKRVRRIE